MTRTHKDHPPDVRLEIGRRYELGRRNRSKALCAEFDITAQMLLNCAAAYRKAAKAIRDTAATAVETAAAGDQV